MHFFFQSQQECVRVYQILTLACVCLSTAMAIETCTSFHVSLLCTVQAAINYELELCILPTFRHFAQEHCNTTVIYRSLNNRSLLFSAE